MTDMMRTLISILCDYDALYSAIELKLSVLPNVHLIRLASSLPNRPDTRQAADESDLIIVASISPPNDVAAALARAALSDCVGRVPVLVIAEHPSGPESADRITYLNFPFDLDDLTQTAMKIVGRRPQERRPLPAPAAGIGA